MLDEKLLVFVLGAPGAGKGTQCDLIVKEYGWTHISAGDLLRAQVKAGTAVGKEAEEYLKQGTMVPASMIIGLLKDALCEAQHTKVLIDGFPRVFDQLKEFEKQVRPCNKALFYKIEEEAARARLMKRSETSGRVDDNEETIRTRFVVFKQESMPVITELETEGRAVEVDASQPPEQVFAVTRRVIEELEQQQAQQAQTAAAVAAEGVPASPAAAGVQSAKAATVLAAAGSVPTSPQLAAASAPGSTPPSPQIPAAAAAAAAATTPTPTSPQAAAVEVTPVSPHQAAAAAPEALPLPSVADAHSRPVAAQATSSTALGAAAATAAAGTGAALAAAGAAAAVAAGSGTSSPLKPDLHVRDEVLAAEAETAAVAQASAASPQAAAAAAAGAATVAASLMPAAVAVPPAGVPAALDVTSPTAASQGPATPSKAMIGSLQVDLSGIRTPVLICGPSGVGKGTLIAKLMEQYPDRFGFSVSHTTRGPRSGEVHGKHYYFTDRESMAAQVAAGMFLEHADVHGNMYGTSLAAVAQVSAAGKHCVLDIDVQGAAQVRKSALGPHCLFIFVAPPSHEELERRLRNRGTETEDKVLQRLANATSEIAKAQEPGLFHHVLVNADLETAHQDLLKLIAQRVPGLLPASQQQAGSSSQRTSEAGGTVTSSTPTAAAAAGQVAHVTAQSPTAAAALPGVVLAGAAAVAAGGVAATSAVQQQQQQQQSPLVNGNASTAAVPGGTAALLDFGFGASAGHASASKGMPVRQYMDTTVIPVLREGLKALNLARPDDPLQFLADYLVSHKAAAA